MMFAVKTSKFGGGEYPPQLVDGLTWREENWSYSRAIGEPKAKLEKRKAHFRILGQDSQWMPVLLARTTPPESNFLKKRLRNFKGSADNLSRSNL